MDIQEILSNLCYYDKRNPECTMTDEELEERKEIQKRRDSKILKNLQHRGVKQNEYTSSCSCDNCFYGRTKLAEEILKLKQYELPKTSE
jgi:hypothetical protein